MKRNSRSAAIRTRLAFEHATTNYYRYQEVYADGQPVDKSELKIGKLYVQKRIFKGAKPPKTLTVKIEKTD